MAALFLILVAAVRLWTGGFESDPLGLPENREIVAAAGQVYKKDGQSICLRNVSVYRQASEETSPKTISDVFISDVILLSQAGFSRQNTSLKENIICYFEDAEEVPLGSHVVVTGVFAPFSQASNPGEFDQTAYYRTLSIEGRLNKTVLLSKGENYWPVREALYHLRNRLGQRIHRALPESQAGVLCALLLGEKS